MSNYDVNDFHSEVIERSRTTPVLVDFWADWCGPCKALGPVLEKLAAAAGDRWVLAKVDTEVHREVAGNYGIRSIPNVKLFVDGEPVSEFVGALPEPQVVQWLEQVLPGPAADVLRAARELLMSDDPGRVGEAQRLLADLVADDPGNTEARVFLSQAKLFEDPAAAAALLEPVASGTPFDDRIDALRTVARLLAREPDAPELADSPAKAAYLSAVRALAARDYEAALEGFIDVAGRDRDLDDDGARAACLALFEILGPEAQATREGRRALARALFV
jgi:putative thioredoxin